MRGSTISSPTMSTKLVMMSTKSFPLVIAENLPRTPDGTLVCRFAERGRRHRTSHDSCQCDDCQHVGNHLDKLGRYRVTSLQLDLQSLGSSKEQARESGTNRIPPSENHRRDRDESPPRRHLIGELMLIERQVNAAEPGENARNSDGCITHALHAHAYALGGIRMVSDR